MRNAIIIKKKTLKKKNQNILYKRGRHARADVEFGVIMGNARVMRYSRALAEIRLLEKWELCDSQHLYARMCVCVCVSLLLAAGLLSSAQYNPPWMAAAEIRALLRSRACYYRNVRHADSPTKNRDARRSREREAGNTPTAAARLYNTTGLFICTTLRHTIDNCISFLCFFNKKLIYTKKNWSKKYSGVCQNKKRG